MIEVTTKKQDKKPRQKRHNLGKLAAAFQDGAATEASAEIRANEANPRSGAFVIATPNNIGIAVRRSDTDSNSGYAVWQVDGKPFVIASPALPGLITQAELADRVNSLARIENARSVNDIQDCAGHVLNALTLRKKAASSQHQRAA